MPEVSLIEALVILSGGSNSGFEGGDLKHEKSKVDRGDPTPLFFETCSMDVG